MSPNSSTICQQIDSRRTYSRAASLAGARFFNPTKNLFLFIKYELWSYNRLQIAQSSPHSLHSGRDKATPDSKRIGQ